MLNQPGKNEAEGVARFIEMKVEEISAVIGILRDVASPRSTIYLGDVKMIDIHAELERKLQQIREKYQA